MRPKGKRSLLRLSFWLLAALAAAVSWWQFLWPPVAYFRSQTPHPGGADILGQLIKPANAIYDEPFLGWAFLLLTAFAVLVLIHWTRAIADYLEHSRVGISVLDTVMDVEMQVPDRTMAIIRRRQVFHANRRGITAYHVSSQTDSATGRILTLNRRLESQVNNRKITKEVISRGSESKLDLIEVYDRELPTSLLATYLPNWLVCMLHGAGLFHDVVVTRSGETTFQNEFDGAEGVYSVSTTKYPISRTAIRVAFVVGYEPADGAIRGFLIRENVVEEVALTRSRTATHDIYEARAQTLHMESLRIQWSF